MPVKSIAECSKGSILQYFRPSLSCQLSLRPLCLFLSDRFTQVLLYTYSFQVYYDMFEIEKRQYEMINKQAAATAYSEKTFTAMQLESDSAVNSLLIKQE